jgi:glucose uptake protein
MILPTSSLAGLLLFVIGLICWGVWANTFKAAGKWRYELYYVDFAFGVLACATLLAFTLGSWNSSELTFQDNFLIASYRRIALGLGAGALFGFANTLLLASLSVSGLAVSFSVSMSLAAGLTQAVDIARGAQEPAVLRIAGALLFLLAAILIAVAHVSRQAALEEASKKEALQIDPRSKQAKFTKKPSRAKGIALAVFSGIVMGFVNPLLDSAREGDSGVAPYGLALLVAAGLLIITFVLSPFVMNFPAAGMPVQVRDYFRGKSRQHMLGILGGMLWGVGMTAYFVALGSSAGAQVARAARVALSESPALVVALAGILVWKEFKDSPDRTRSFLLAFSFAFLAAVVLTAVA